MSDDPRDGQNDKPISGDGRHAGPDAGENRNSRPDHDDASGPKSAGAPETESDGDRGPIRRSGPAEPARTPEDARLTGIGGWLTAYVVFQALNILPFLNNLRSDGADDAPGHVLGAEQPVPEVGGEGEPLGDHGDRLGGGQRA